MTISRQNFRSNSAGRFYCRGNICKFPYGVFDKTLPKLKNLFNQALQLFRKFLISFIINQILSPVFDIGVKRSFEKILQAVYSGFYDAGIFRVVQVSMAIDKRLQNFLFWVFLSLSKSSSYSLNDFE